MPECFSWTAGIHCLVARSTHPTRSSPFLRMPSKQALSQNREATLPYCRGTRTPRSHQSPPHPSWHTFCARQHASHEPTSTIRVQWAIRCQRVTQRVLIRVGVSTLLFRAARARTGEHTRESARVRIEMIRPLAPNSTHTAST